MMTSPPLTSSAHIDYGIDTLFGRDTRSADCEVGLEQVEGEPNRFALRVQAPVPKGLEKANTLLVHVDGRRLNGVIRHIERLNDDSLKLEVEPE